MSLYTPWTTYGVSPLPPIAPSESSSNREALWTDTRNPELLRYAMNLTGSGPQLALSEPEPAHGSRLKRPPPPGVPRPLHVPTTDPSYYCHSLMQKNRANELPNLVSRNSVSPTNTHHYSYPPASSSYDHLIPARQFPYRNSPHLPQQNLQGPNHSSPIISPTQAALYPITTYSTYSSEPPRRSKAALAAEDWDHPSFARPPHRPIDPKPKASAIPRIVDLPSIHVPTSLGIQYEIPKPTEPEESLVPSSYPVPPPPPYEQSAAPLADLAAEMVWERCFNPPQHRSNSISPLMNTLASPVNDVGFSWPLSTDHPPHYARGYDHISTKFGYPWDPAPSEHHRRISPVNTFGAIGAEAKARRAQQAHQHNGIKPMKTETKPAFRRWTRQVLEQTLLSPQVLVLALYYVDVLSGKDVFGDANRGKASLMPYKILLAGLVLANKTLDDHSYKNSTFANVSSMTNAEVNTIEVAMLKALNFDTVPNLEEWGRWVGEVVRAGERVGMGLRLRKKEEEGVIRQLKHQQAQAFEYLPSFGTHHSHHQHHASISHISPLQHYSIAGGGYRAQAYSIFNE